MRELDLLPAHDVVVRDEQTSEWAEENAVGAHDGKVDGAAVEKLPGLDEDRDESGEVGATTDRHPAGEHRGEIDLGERQA